MNQMTKTNKKVIQEALDAAFAELNAMSPEKFKEELEKSAKSELARMIYYGLNPEDPECEGLK